MSGDTRDKGTGAIDLRTSSNISLFCWLEGGEGDIIRVEAVDRVKGNGRSPPHTASWAENTIMTECTL